MSRHLPFLAKFVFLELLIVATGSRALCDANPVSVDVQGTLHWKYNGINRMEKLMLFNRYHPDAEGWCAEGCQTAAGTKYEHLHVTTQFPYQSVVYGYSVTPAMVDLYWDSKFSDYQRLSSADQTCNCHGFSTGYDTSWITEDGMLDILYEEYEGIYGLDAVLEHIQVSEHYGHSKQVFDLFDLEEKWDIRVGRIREKNLESGVYQLSNMERSLANGYRKKP